MIHPNPWSLKKLLISITWLVILALIPGLWSQIPPSWSLITSLWSLIPHTSVRPWYIVCGTVTVRLGIDKSVSGLAYFVVYIHVGEDLLLEARSTNNPSTYHLSLERSIRRLPSYFQISWRPRRTDVCCTRTLNTIGHPRVLTVVFNSRGRHGYAVTCLSWQAYSWTLWTALWLAAIIKSLPLVATTTWQSTRSLLKWSSRAVTHTSNLRSCSLLSR